MPPLRTRRAVPNAKIRALGDVPGTEGQTLGARLGQLSVVLPSSRLYALTRPLLVELRHGLRGGRPRRPRHADPRRDAQVAEHRRRQRARGSHHDSSERPTSNSRTVSRRSSPGRRPWELRTSIGLPRARRSRLRSLSWKLVTYSGWSPSASAKINTWHARTKPGCSESRSQSPRTGNLYPCAPQKLKPRWVPAGSDGAGRRDACGQRRDERLVNDVQSVSCGGSVRSEPRGPARNAVVHRCNGDPLRQDPPEMPLVERNHPIETLAPGRPNEAFAMRVRFRRSHRCFQHMERHRTKGLVHG